MGSTCVNNMYVRGKLHQPPLEGLPSNFTVLPSHKTNPRLHISLRSEVIFEKVTGTLAGVAQWPERSPAN